MKCRNIIINNKLGMHARASAKFVSLAAEFKSQITLARDSRSVNGKSIMGIMMLAAGKGTELKLCADGGDEDHALDALCTLVSDRFGEGE